MTPKQAQQGLLGLLIGDALGVPYEFRPAKEIPSFAEIEFEPPPRFTKTYSKVPAGTWSDDGAQALCLVDALLDKSSANLATRLATRLLDWRSKGYMAVDGKVFDIGTTTNKALDRIASGVPCKEAGITGARAKSNGSLMRALPIAFFFKDDEALVKAALEQSMVTHAEIEPLLCCAAYVLWARNVADTKDSFSKAWTKAFKQLLAIVRGPTEDFVEGIQNWDGTPAGTGSVVDALHSAKKALVESSDYESAVKRAIQFGNDTDTTAAIVGGIAGIRYGSIPKRWTSALRGQEILKPILRKLK